ncbi:MAG TPA: hypothetical protein VF406_09560 [Thermodesulfobacteriota bacterium]
MKQIWLVVVFVVVMLLIGYGWQGDPVTAGASGTALPAGEAHP